MPLDGFVCEVYESPKKSPSPGRTKRGGTEAHTGRHWCYWYRKNGHKAHTGLAGNNSAKQTLHEKRTEKFLQIEKEPTRGKHTSKRKHIEISEARAR